MRKSTSVNVLWTDGELADAVDVYVFMLRAQAAGLVYRKEAAASAMLEEGFPARNPASLRYRFRNISAVARELGGPVLAGYTPAEQVGSVVRERIRALLLTHSYFIERLASPIAGHPIRAQSIDFRFSALEALSTLRKHINDLEGEHLGIGHNNPPEPISSAPRRRTVFDEARSDITALERELAKPQADVRAVALRSEKLLQFGVTMLMWAGQRTTKFVDVALAALAPVLVVKVTGLLPLLIDALDAVARAVTH